MLKWRTPKGPQLRHCAKVALAAVIAYALTLGERNEYALFSVLGAALVVGGSVGEELTASLNRAKGTLAGALVGIAVAHALGMSIWSLGVSVALLTWVCLGLGWGGPAIRVGIAMVLVVVFTHALDATSYGLWRVLNTVIGVAIGFAVSRFMWPIRGRGEIARAIDETLAATHALLGALGTGASSDALLPLQTRLFDALAAVRTARKFARLERRIDPGTDLLHTHTMPALRAGVLALGASIMLDELTHADVRVECLHPVRQAFATLAEELRATAGAGPRADEFAARYESALCEAARPELDPGTRGLLVGLLAELQQIREALKTLHGARGPAAAPSSGAPG